MEKEFTNEQSLAVIKEMIQQSRNQIQKGEGKYMLLWGYVITLASIAHFIWLMSDRVNASINASWVWVTAFIVGLIVTILFAIKDKKETVVRTYAGMIAGSIWMGFGVGVMLIFILLNGRQGIYIYPSIAFLYTYALFMSARVYKFRWMYIAVAICLVCVVLYRFIDYMYYPLLYAIIMTLGNIVPGHIINQKNSSGLAPG